MKDEDLDKTVEIAHLIDRIQRECEGNGTGPIAQLVRIHGWKFEVKLGDDGVFVGVLGKPE